MGPLVVLAMGGGLFPGIVAVAVTTGAGPIVGMGAGPVDV
jgi:hypothetical protein